MPSSARDSSETDKVVHVFGVEGDRFTGAGQILRALELHLPAVLPTGWDLLVENGDLGIMARLMQPSSADASLWVCTPLPLRRSSPRHAHFVFDLRWQRTRSRTARLYRKVDLIRIAKRADRIFTISEHVATEIRENVGSAVDVVVVPMGPGQVEGRPIRTPADNRTLLLLGRAAHKRNEMTAKLLVASSLVRSRYRVIAASVSDDTKKVLQESSLDVEFVDDISSEHFGELLERVSTYVNLGVDEGFGLPFAEAAYCGADVIAVDLPVAREALGPDGNFVPDQVTVEHLEDGLERWDADRVRRLRDRARQRSWIDCAESVADWIASV